MKVRILVPVHSGRIEPKAGHFQSKESFCIRPLFRHNRFGCRLGGFFRWFCGFRKLYPLQGFEGGTGQAVFRFFVAAQN